jgi:hypothetical protein
MKLTKEQISFLKQCNTICFRHCYGTTGRIEAYITEKRNDIRYIDIESDAPGVSGAFITCNMYDTIEYVLSKLTPKDEISLVWCPDYSTNQYVHDANLHCDALLLSINSFRVVIRQSVCANNSARMPQLGK